MVAERERATRRQLSGRLKSTVRRHKFNNDSLSCAGGVERRGYGAAGAGRQPAGSLGELRARPPRALLQGGRGAARRGVLPRCASPGKP